MSFQTTFFQIILLLTICLLILVADILGESLTSADIIEQVNTNSLLHYLGIKEQNFFYPQVMFTATDYTCSAGDGTVYYLHGSWDWNAATTAATGTTVINSDVAYEVTVEAERNAGSAANCARAFIPSDTSGLTSSAAISATTFNWFITTINAVTQFTQLSIVSSTQASGTTLATTDYSLVGSTTFCDKLISALTDDTNNVFTLNATGIAAISKTSYTKMAVRSDADLTNTFTPAGASDGVVNGYGSSHATGKPYYAITYTVGGGGGNFAYYLDI